jgi:hypothetical protein
MIYEVALSVADNPGPGRRSVGDIVVIREPLGTPTDPYPGPEIGDKEVKDYLWLQMDLTQTFVQEFRDRREAGEKFPFQIRLPDLKQREPDLDIAKAQDLNQEHQPFLRRNPQTHQVIFVKDPLKKAGLIIDKRLGFGGGRP